MKVIKTRTGREILVDDDIHEILSEYCISAECFKKLKTNGKPKMYARVYSRKSSPVTLNKICLHWFVVGQPLDGYEVDHINGDGLDNRRENLRIVTRSQNLINRNGWGKLGEKNISLTNYGRYSVTIRRGKKTVVCKYFETLEDAIIYRDKKIIEIDGKILHSVV